MSILKTEFKETEIGLIPEDWEYLHLEKFAKLIKNACLPDCNEEVAYIGLEHIDQQTLSLNSVGTSSDVTSNKFKFESGDILFGKLRPYFRKVYRPKFSGICSTDIWVVRAKEGFDQGWLFYFLANEDFINSASGGSGGTRMPRADWNHVKDTVWPIPSLSEQSRVASILSSLDDKIELNRQMNTTLEAMAGALFKRWFVDFEFPDENGKPYKSSGGKMVEGENGEMVPEGWRTGLIREIAVLSKDGLNPGKFGDEIFNHYSIPAFDEGKIPKQELGEMIKSNKFLVTSNCVLLSKLNPITPRIWLPLIDDSFRAICSTEFLVMIPKKNISREFLFCLFSSRDFQDIFASGVTGTSGSHQRVRPQGLMSLETVVPSDRTIGQFSSVIQEILYQINESIEQSRILRAYRDSLLPKLISGKIRIN